MLPICVVDDLCCFYHLIIILWFPVNLAEHFPLYALWEAVVIVMIKYSFVPLQHRGKFQKLDVVCCDPISWFHGEGFQLLSGFALQVRYTKSLSDFRAEVGPVDCPGMYDTLMFLLHECHLEPPKCDIF